MGKKAEALSGLSNSASLSQQKAISDSTNSFNSKAATMQLAGSLAGAAAGSYKGGTGDKNFSADEVGGVRTPDPYNAQTNPKRMA